ncbi:AMP-binding protein, partial [Streptomyces sp. YC419]|nr:AMP-binding protein [Streptomyces ureilyticus]
MWIEDVPVPSSHPLAEHRRSAELARPAKDLRRVLLRYTDGSCDLIVVAHRNRWGSTALTGLTATETAASAPGRETSGHRGGTPQTPVSAPAVTPVPVPAWGLPGDDTAVHCHTVPLDEVGDEAGWLTALYVTLRRYEPGTTPVIGTDHGTFSCEPAPTLGELKPTPTDGSPLTGLLFTDGFLPDEYTACLAPSFPLTISVIRDSRGTHLRCDHLGGHISPEIATQFTRHLTHIHHQLLHSPHIPLTDVELLDTAERTRIAALGKPPRSLTTTPTTIPDAFARVAATNFDRIALTDGATSLTFSELDARSAKLAQGLRARGVTPGDRVGVCLERTAELVVTLLAVLKAGAAYVPVDPAYPAERLAHTAQDAGLGVVITRLAEFPAAARRRTSPWPPRAWAAPARSSPASG